METGGQFVKVFTGGNTRKKRCPGDSVLRLQVWGKGQRDRAIRKVLFDGGCSPWGNYPLKNTRQREKAIWAQYPFKGFPPGRRNREKSSS